MGRLTTDPQDPDLTHGVDEKAVEQAEAYLIKEDTGDYVRPVRQSYVHTVCGATTTMGLALAQTYAMDPTFYGATYCVLCMKHRPVSEFVWAGTDEVVGS